MKLRICIGLGLITGTLLLATGLQAQSWPTYRHDMARSGKSDAVLKMPLQETFRFQSPHRPKPAWPGPAKRDAYNKVENLEPRLAFDRAFHIVGENGHIYFGSSADDQVRCLDGKTGKLIWNSFTEGPVRFAPTLKGGRVYVGSDDGYAYCLNQKSGRQVWRFRAAERDVRVPGNGRLMSPWPVRTSLIVDKNTAYFCAGLFPSEGAWLCALSAQSGKKKFQYPLSGTHPQGYMLASRTRLYLPTGRGRPAVHQRKNGAKIRDMSGQGGTFALLVGDSLIYGPGKTGQLGEFAGSNADQVATFHGLHMIVDGDLAWLHSGRDVSALHRTRFLRLTSEQRTLSARRKALQEEVTALRKKAKGKAKSAVGGKQTRELEKIGKKLQQISADLPACVLWRTPCDLRYEMVMARGVLLLGGDGEVQAFSAKDGKKIWQAPVSGRAWGLAVVDDSLYVSTDEGVIHGFSGGVR
jgi:outer membrane protein assembly factor BamB